MLYTVKYIKINLKWIMNLIYCGFLSISLKIVGIEIRTTKYYLKIIMCY